MKTDCNCTLDRQVRADHKCFACVHKGTYSSISTENPTCRNCVLPLIQTYNQKHGSNFEPTLDGFILLGGCMVSDWSLTQLQTLHNNASPKAIRSLRLRDICKVPSALREITRFCLTHWEDFGTINKIYSPEDFLKVFTGDAQ